MRWCLVKEDKICQLCMPPLACMPYGPDHVDQGWTELHRLLDRTTQVAGQDYQEGFYDGFYYRAWSYGIMVVSSERGQV